MSTEVTQIELLKKGDQKVISTIYMEYRTGFKLFANAYPLESTVVLDIYQDAVVALCENAKKGLLDNLQCSLKTYLFSIGKFMIFKQLKSKSQVEFHENIDPDVPVVWEAHDEEQAQEKIQNMKQALDKIGEPCKTILSLFYFEEKKLDEILEIMDYKNKDVLKSQKSRCLNKLKEMLA